MNWQDFEHDTPGWESQGVEPPAERKTQGYQPGYAPPADWFNWFWTRVSKCVTEIQEKIKALWQNTYDKDEIDAALDNKANLEPPQWMPLPVASGASGGKYRKELNAVYLQGNVALLAGANLGGIATLPIGFRPDDTISYIQATSGGGSCRISINPSGNMAVQYSTVALPFSAQITYSFTATAL